MEETEISAGEEDEEEELEFETEDEEDESEKEDESGEEIDSASDEDEEDVQEDEEEENPLVVKESKEKVDKTKLWFSKVRICFTTFILTFLVSCDPQNVIPFSSFS